jgi:hypothetical protein
LIDATAAFQVLEKSRDRDTESHEKFRRRLRVRDHVRRRNNWTNLT